MASSSNGQGVRSLPYYRPLTKAYYIIASSIFGEKTWGYKLASLFLHSIIASLVFYLVLSITAQIRVAFLAAFFFAINPIHTEAVVWTYSVSYLLVAIFSLSTLLLYRSGRVWLALATFSAALLNHEIGVLLLPILVLSKWLLDDAKHWSNFRTLVPFAIALALFLVIRRWNVGGIPLTSLGFQEFANTAVVVAAQYLKIVFWPDSAVTVYQYKTFTDFSFQVVAAYAVCIGLLVLAYLLFRRDRKSLFWLFWFGAWISISFNFGQMGEYMMADKLVYIASIGIFVLLSIWLNRLFQNNFYWLLVCFLPFIFIQVYETWHRIGYWQDTSTYLEASLDHEPDFYLTLYTLSALAVVDKDYDKAHGLLLRTVKSRPNYSPALNNLANISYMRGDLHTAASYWERAIKYDPTNPMPHFNLGVALRALDRTEDAKASFDRYLQYQPNPSAEVLRRLKSFGY